MLEVYLEMLEQGYYEAKIAFDGLSDEHVWIRPASGLWSVGELAGHIAFWQAIKFTGCRMDDDLSKCPIVSPLIDRRFYYYNSDHTKPPTEQLLAIPANQVCTELLRVHRESVAHLKALNPDLKSTPAGWSEFWTYGKFLKYAVFHVAYHTGQMYSARHLLGEITPDN